jgi:hypothetical protein
VERGCAESQPQPRSAKEWPVGNQIKTGQKGADGMTILEKLCLSAGGRLQA